MTGEVTLDGVPLSGATIMLQPVEGGSLGYGVTDDNGLFVVSTFEVGDGAIPGEHGIVVKLSSTATETSSDSDGKKVEVPTKQIPKLPARYSKVETSGFKVIVEEGLEPLVLELTSIK